MDIKLFLGDSCNLRCSYCYQEHGNGKISKEILKKVADEINKIEEDVNLNFFGGEPTLYTDEILYFLKHIKSFENISFSITTNGTNINSIAKIQNVIKKDISILLSNKDGVIPSRINSKTSFRFVISKEVIQNPDYNYISVVNSMFKDKLHFICNYSDFWDSESFKKLLSFKTKIYELGVANYNFDFPIIGGTPICNYSQSVINWNGDILACHRMPTTVIGNIFEDGLKVSNLEQCIYVTNNPISANFSNLASRGITTYCGGCG